MEDSTSLNKINVDDEEEEINTTYCPYKKVTNFLGGIFGGKNQPNDKTKLSTEDEEKPKCPFGFTSSKKEEKPKCPFGFTSSKKEEQPKCPFGFTSSNLALLLLTKLQKDVAHLDSEPRMMKIIIK